jgi:signal transduction histidine kinase
MSLDQRLSPPIEAAFYYVSSEALTNVTRYARATTVEIQVSTDEGAAVLRIHDDGAGGAEPRDGGGIQGLADRVDALGGQLTVNSLSGLGTTLEAHVPLLVPDPGPGS